MSRIVYDPGHGGRDPGAVGPTGLREKDVVLEIGLELKKIMQEEYVCDFRLTRQTDVYLSHQQRCDIANNFGADLFVSGHINAFSDSAANGFESYRWNGLPEGHKTETIQRAVHLPVKNYVGILGVRDRGMRSANFYVLRNTRMSAVLLEYMFISNVREEALLRLPDTVKGLAASTAEGIARALELEKRKEEVTLEEVAIVYHSGDDEPAARRLANRLNCGLFPRTVAERRIVGKRIIIVGGSRGDILGDNFIDLSGDRYFTTVEAVKKYIQNL